MKRLVFVQTQRRLPAARAIVSRVPPPVPRNRVNCHFPDIPIEQGSSDRRRVHWKINQSRVQKDPQNCFRALGEWWRVPKFIFRDLSSTLDSSTLDSSVANYPNKCPFRLPRHKANQTTDHPGVASPVAATAEIPHRKRAGTRDLNHMNRPDQQKSTKPAILINCRHARIPSSVVSISAASLSLRTRDKERSRSRWKLTQAEQSTACRIVLQRQPSRILLTAGNALLNEVHAFDTIVDVWIERITSIKIFS